MDDAFHWALKVRLNAAPDVLLSSDPAAVLFHLLQCVILVHNCHFDCHILPLDNHYSIAGVEDRMWLDVVTLIVDEVMQSVHVGQRKATGVDH